MKMPTIVGIFIFISRENFMLSSAEHEKSLITSGPGVSNFYLGIQKNPWILDCNNKSLLLSVHWVSCASCLANSWVISFILFDTNSKLILHYIQSEMLFLHMDRVVWKYVFGHIQTANAQLSLCICTSAVTLDTTECLNGERGPDDILHMCRMSWICT